MSLQGIIEKIQNEAETEVSAIKAEAEKKSSEIIETAKGQKSEIESSFNLKLKKQQAHRQAVVESLEKQRESMALQVVKRKALDEAYKEALTQLLATNEAEYVQMLVKRYKDLVPADIKVASIKSPENRIKETGEIAKQLGWEAEIVTDAKLKGGCVLVGADFEYDLSLEKLFSENRSNSEIEIANILFSKA